MALASITVDSTESCGRRCLARRAPHACLCCCAMCHPGIVVVVAVVVRRVLTWPCEQPRALRHRAAVMSIAMTAAMQRPSAAVRVQVLHRMRVVLGNAGSGSRGCGQWALHC